MVTGRHVRRNLIWDARDTDLDDRCGGEPGAAVRATRKRASRAVAKAPERRGSGMEKHAGGRC